MLKVKAIASGSNGNCTLLQSESGPVLIDVGISAKRIVSGLADTGIQPDELVGIFITHEHSDHVQGLKIFLKKHPTNVYCSKGTMQAIFSDDKKGELNQKLFHPISSGDEMRLGSLKAACLSTYHDAAEPLCYRFTEGQSSFGLFTDSGHYSDTILRFFTGVNGMLLESNFDEHMLEVGSYPYMLKRRILGDFGHLSNTLAYDFLESLYGPDLRLVIAGHLSGENNLPELCELNLKNLLDVIDMDRHTRLVVARRDCSTDVYEI